MVKSEKEIQKVVKAMALLYMNSTFNAYSFVTPAEFVKGVKATITLLPGQNTEAESLIHCEIKNETPNNCFIPNSGYVSYVLKEFVLAVRKVFTSIHEYKKFLSYTTDKVPDEHDMDWVYSVLKTYGIDKSLDIYREYVLLIPVPNSDMPAIAEIGSGTQALENMDLFVKGQWFIERVPGLEAVASKEEERGTLRPTTFREI